MRIGVLIATLGAAGLTACQEAPPQQRSGTMDQMEICLERNADQPSDGRWICADRLSGPIPANAGALRAVAQFNQGGTAIESDGYFLVQLENETSSWLVTRMQVSVFYRDDPRPAASMLINRFWSPPGRQVLAGEAQIDGQALDELFLNRSDWRMVVDQAWGVRYEAR